MATPSSSAAPALSVVLATPDDYETIRLTLQYLRAQTACRQMEVVLVAPSELRIPYGALGPFWGHQLVSAGAVTSVARANAAGVRVARAPIVALGEDHCFPEPGWAEALIAAHRGPWA